MKHRILAVMFIATLIGGCGPSKPLVHERNLPAAEVISRVREHDGKILTISGEGSITIESPETSGSGSFEASVRKPDSLVVELHGPFGVRIGTLALSSDQILYYDWRENRATIGKPDASTLQSMLRIRLEMADLVHAFTGELLVEHPEDTLESFSVEDDLYVLRYKTAEGTREYRVDGDSYIVTSYRLIDAGGKAVMIAQASKFDEIDEMTVPTLLRVILPKERRSITIAYGDLRINDSVRCAFSPPGKANIIRR